MSRQKYWWGYVKWVIRFQPERETELKRRQSAKVTPNYNAQPGGSEPSRTTENLGTVSLGEPADTEMEAVRRAIEETRSLPDGAERLRLVDLVFWRRTHTLTGACLECHTSERTGRRWHTEFIYQVAKNMHLK